MTAPPGPAGLGRARAERRRRPGPAAAMLRAALLRDPFVRDYYGGAAITQLDTVFLATYAFMCGIMRRTAVTERPADQLCINLALALNLAMLAAALLHRGAYMRARVPLVLAFHLCMTALRAALVLSMASEQAVYWRGRVGGGGPRGGGGAGAYLLSIMATGGGLIRHFEVIGLQQPLALHILVCAAYAPVQLYAGLHGFRLAYTNALFYNAHQVHDAVAAVADTLLELLVPLPTSQSDSCSSCPGPVVYASTLLFCGVAVPMYVAHLLERTARQRHARAGRRAAALAAAGGAGARGPAVAQRAGGSSSGGGGAGGSTNSSGGARGSGNSSSASGSGRDGPSVLTPATAAAASAASAAAATALAPRGASAVEEEQEAPPPSPPESPWAWLPPEAVAALERDVSRGHSLGSLTASLLVLLCTMLCCWHACAAVVYVLLPRVLSAWQLERLCPSRPYAPFVAAGRVYDPAADEGSLW